MIDEKAARWRILPPSPSTGPTLTAQQLEAASPSSGVTVVVGGPGTGKTETLLAAVDARLAGGAPLAGLAVVVGSRTEAQRIRRRILRRSGSAQVAPRITTIHGLSLGWLRDLDDGDAAWRLLAAPEQELRIRDLLDELGTGFWPAAYREAVGTRAFARQVREFLARARQLSLDPTDLAGWAEQQSDELLVRLAAFFETYLTVSDFDGSLDYAELVYRTRLLLRDPRAAEELRRGTQAIIADDIQSMDAAQAGLLMDCASVGIPVHTFGDPQQRIHGFRGASLDAMDVLASSPGVRRFELAQGFRNASAVRASLDGVAARISAAGAAAPPDAAPGPDGLVTARVFDNTSAEWAHLAADLRRAVALDGLSWAELAVIVRSGRRNLHPLARELVRHGIPVESVHDGGALADSPGVRVLLAALEAASAGNGAGVDGGASLLATPIGGLDGLGLRRLGRALLVAHPGAGSSDDLIAGAVRAPEALAALDLPEARQVMQLAGVLGAARDRLQAGAAVEEALWCLWDGTDWPARLRKQAMSGSLYGAGELDAIVALFDLAARRQHLTGVQGARTFQTEVRGQEIAADTGRELRPTARGVTVTTAHGAASGEWRRVWITGVQEGTWPMAGGTGPLLDPDRLSADGLLVPGPRSPLADERRLFHVACSRAGEQLHVSGCEDEETGPSRFLGELGVEVRRIHGRPSRRPAAPVVIGGLRRAVTDRTAPEGMRRSAALRLAALADLAGRDGVAEFRAASPRAWWGGRTPTSGAPALPDPVVIAASGLQDLLDCPRRWFLSKRVGAERPRASGASFGDVLHLLAQHSVTDGLGASELRELLEGMWDQMRFESEWLARSELDEAKSAMDRFSAWQVIDGAEVVGVEVPFRVEVPVGTRTVVLTGSVDRLELIEGRLRVIDLKTGRRLPTRAEVSGHAQLGVYQLAAQLGAFDALAPGVRNVAPPGLLMLRHGAALPTLLTQPTLEEQPALSDVPLEVGPTWVHDALARAADVLSSGEYPACRCAGCSWCPFVHSCPVWHRSSLEVAE